MPIALTASHRHYLDHLLPVWRALPAEERGAVYLGGSAWGLLPDALPIDRLPDEIGPVLLAGFDDLRHSSGQKIILMEHGIGQSYGAIPSENAAAHPAYAGGEGRHGVCGFLCPNSYAADRNRAAYPDAYVTVVGSPRLAYLQTIPAPPAPTEHPVVAFSFHSEVTLCMETRNAWNPFSTALPDLARSGEFELLGHAHPRLFPSVKPFYTEWGIEPVASFEEVLARAHCFVADNTSSLYEFAAVRGPVVVMDAPTYRRDVEHGLRFWDAADIGPRIADPAALKMAIRSALTKTPWPGAEERLDRVFPPIEDPAQVAAAATLHAAGLVAPVVRTGARFPGR